MKIYTKTGDDGTTGLFGGTRVDKDSMRVAAYGSVDETNAAIGVAVAGCRDSEMNEWLRAIQSDLFTIGGELASPSMCPGAPALPEARVAELEQLIDRLESSLTPVKWFVLPGGVPTAAALHFARTVCRRAEREMVRLQKSESLRPLPGVYVNRLSDCLFVMARYANHQAATDDIPWKASEPDK